MPELNTGSCNRSWLPSLDLHEENGELVLHADLRGFDDGDVEVSLDGGDLMCRRRARIKAATACTDRSNLRSGSCSTEEACHEDEYQGPDRRPRGLRVPGSPRSTASSIKAS